MNGSIFWKEQSKTRSGYVDNADEYPIRKQSCSTIHSHVITNNICKSVRFSSIYHHSSICRGGTWRFMAKILPREMSKTINTFVKFSAHSRYCGKNLRLSNHMNFIHLTVKQSSIYFQRWGGGTRQHKAKEILF